MINQDRRALSELERQIRETEARIGRANQAYQEVVKKKEEAEKTIRRY